MKTIYSWKQNPKMLARRVSASLPVQSTFIKHFIRNGKRTMQTSVHFTQQTGKAIQGDLFALDTLGLLIGLKGLEPTILTCLIDPIVILTGLINPTFIFAHSLNDVCRSFCEWALQSPVCRGHRQTYIHTYIHTYMFYIKQVNLWQLCS